MALDDELINRITWKIPNALALVGSAHDGERNGMTTSWITQLSMEPVLVGIGVDNSAVTHRLISASGAFTVNLWDSENTRPFVKFSKPAVDNGVTLNGWSVHTAATGAPVFDDSIAWIDCVVRHSLDLGTPHPVRRGDRRRRDPRRRGPPSSDERHTHEVRRREAPLSDR